jgi:NAD(P)-dependent dehydrogenase (short-subunit alcohol dehydrogenase family)
MAKNCSHLACGEPFRALGLAGVNAFAVHPGAVSTELGRYISEAEMRDIGRGSEEGTGLVFKSIQQGAATKIWAATSATLTGQGGLYLADYKVGLPV